MIPIPKLPNKDLLKHKRVILRLDLNVPIRNGVITDTFRIEKVLPTIRFLSESGSKVVIVSHIEGLEKTLLPVFNYISNILPAKFILDPWNPDGENTLLGMADGDVVMIENIRNFNGEIINDDDLARNISSLGDLYVNEAFAVSHREHASIVGVPKYLPSYAGPLFIKEYEILSTCFKPSHPFLFILGGAKFDTKIPLIEKFSSLSDTMFIGGALSNDVYKSQGYEVGTSLVSKNHYDISSLMQKGNIMLPIDVTVVRNGKKTIVSPKDISKTEAILDAGTKAIEMLSEKIKEASFILWNGPLGNYEEGFKDQTLALASLLSESKAKTIVGGGDTLASIAELGLFDKFSFVSTAGGAMLDFLAHETLPGIDALLSQKI